MCWLICGLHPGKGKIYFSLKNAQTTSGDLPASYLTDTVSFTLGVQWLWHEKDHSSPSPAEVKECSYSPTPTICFHDSV